MPPNPSQEFTSLAANTPLSGITPEWLSPAELPAPCQKLLFHDKDMTSTLARYHDEAILLEVLHAEKSETSLRREVLLKTYSGTVVEYGLIQIDFAPFPAELRSAVTEAHEPLGGLLNSHGFPYLSAPLGYFCLRDFTPSFLPPTRGHPLFGRLNRLTDLHGNPFARIIEILPPEYPDLAA